MKCVLQLGIGKPKTLMGIIKMYTISNNTTKIQISEFGAEVRSVIHNGKERAWQNETGEWSGCAILLFPFAGINRLVYDGVDFGYQRHGLCRNEEFTIISQTENSIEFELFANERTRTIYPFEFAFRVKYELVEGGYEISYTVENKDRQEIPFACGGHESFVLDDDVEQYFVAFEKSEKFDFMLHNSKGLLTGQNISHGEGQILELEKEFTDNGSTVILGDINSRRVALYHKHKNEKVVELTFDGFSNLLLWHPHGSKMLCIEPWQCLPSYVNEIKEFKDRKGVIRLDANCEITYIRTITY